MGDGGHIFKEATRLSALPKEGKGEGEEVWTWSKEEDSSHKEEEIDHWIQTVEDWSKEEERRRKEYSEEFEGVKKPEESEVPSKVSKAGEGEYRDGTVKITTRDDGTTVVVMMTGPAGDGQDVTTEQVRDALKVRNMVFGIGEEKILAVLEEKMYSQESLIAEGKQPVVGRDGQIKDYSLRKAELEYASKDNGDIDHKNLSLIHNVKAGQVAYDIARPTLPQGGMGARGRTVHGKTGTTPPIPQGENVVLSEDNGKLITTCEGNLTFRSGRFLVKKILEVASNMDNSVGNIEFAGSVVIRGDMYEGSEVTAKGDITVMGMVEGALLDAAGSIVLQKGMCDMKMGIPEADEDITAKFLESCKIYVKRDIRVEYIISPEIPCGHDLVLNGHRGVLIGGSCSVYNCMTVREVGVANNVTTTATLGMTSQLAEEMKRSGEGLERLIKKLAEIQEDIAHLVSKEKNGTIMETQKARLKELNLERPVISMKQERLREKTSEPSEQVQEAGGCRLSAGCVDPGTVLSIGDGELYFAKQGDNCYFYFRDGKIRKGMR